MGVAFNSKPRDFCAPDLWLGDVDQKIGNAVKRGKGRMIPLNLSPDKIKEVKPI